MEKEILSRWIFKRMEVERSAPWASEERPFSDLSPLRKGRDF